MLKPDHGVLAPADGLFPLRSSIQQGKLRNTCRRPGQSALGIQPDPLFPPDLLTGLKADGSSMNSHQAALLALPASQGRPMRCPSTGFNG